MGDDGVGFLPGEHDGQLGRPADSFHAGDVLQLLVEDLLVEKKERTKRLVLSGGGDMAVDGEMAEEGSDLFLAHLGGMALVVEEDVAADPVQVELLRAEAVVLYPQMPANAVEELRRSGGAGDRRGTGHRGLMVVQSSTRGQAENAIGRECG